MAERAGGDEKPPTDVLPMIDTLLQARLQIPPRTLATVSLPIRSLRVWLLLQCTVWIPVLLVLAVRPDAAGSWTLGGCVSVATISFAALWQMLGARTAADGVTAGRLLATGLAVVGVGFAGRVTWPAFGAVLLAALADLLDGWVARRRGPTERGALLDMEADQLFVVLLSVTAATQGLVGSWVLLLPGYRYVYVAVLAVLGIPAHDPRPRGDNRRGKLICALTVSALLVVLLPIAPDEVRRGAALLAVVMLGWSFATDAAHLVARRVRSPSETA